MITRRGVLAALLGAAAAEIILPPTRTIFLPPRGGWPQLDGYDGQLLRWYDEFNEGVRIASERYRNGLAVVNSYGNGTQTISPLGPGDWHRYTIKGLLS